MNYLQSNPGIAAGELTIKNTRIRIAQVISMLANGYTIKRMHNEWFPHLSTETLKGAVEEATQHLSNRAHA
jgi:uncharacterized protein (DUF433 family)